MSNEKVGPEQLSGLIDALHVASEKFTAADSAYSAASRDRTNALNALNQAQKALQSGIDNFKAQAPRDSDWASQSQRRNRVSEG